MAVELEKYDAMQAKGFISGKMICPACKQKTFVPYTDERTGEFIDANLYGMCDRKNNCEYHVKVPFGYFKNGEGARRASPTVNNIIPFTRPPAYVNRLPYEYVTKSLARDNSKCNFINYLIKIFDIDVAKHLVDKYLLGVDKWNDVIFWQIDENGEVRSGKTIPYWPEGKRKKKPETDFEVGFIHKKAKDKSGALLYPNYKSEQCLYGEHLLNEAPPDAPVIIVESEKTAIIASVYAPFYFRGAVCLATGGENGLSKEKLKVLAGREVLVWPDAGFLESWKEKVKSFKFENITESDFIDDLEGEPKNSDFVDFLEFDENGKALTIIDNLYTWTDGGEIIDELLPFARNPIYFDFKYYLHKINKAPNVSTASGALYPKTLIENEKRKPAKIACNEI